MILRKLLIVDDNAMNRMILRGMLKDDYDILEAENGEIALSVLRATPDDISAVLLDILMPVMDGYQVLTAMRGDQKLAAIPVIVTTGSTDEGTEIKALAMGANDFIGKPYNFAIARHRIRNAIYFRETAATLNATLRDDLTGLYSRKAFFEKAAELIETHEPGFYVLTALDVDNFKVINDQYGDHRGDEVLIHIADTLNDNFGAAGGLCCRIMADKFAVLYPGAAFSHEELASIRQIAAEFDRSMPAMTISAGRYIVSDTNLDVSAMYDRALIAQTTVKGRFDMHVAQYDESMRERILREQEIVNDKDEAIATGQFEPWFQPQYNHATGALIGAEALVRWRHPKKGLIPPFEFIPVFERNGFIYTLDKCVWEQVCRQLHAWMDEGREVLPVSVNISRFDLFQDDFFDTVVGLIDRYDIPVDLLRLEVTESAFVQSAERLISIVKRLVDYGFTVEIDDFGSGYSSLNTLKDVPANILKLDLRFLEDDENSQRGGNILESIVRMARWLGMPVIAEGVETFEQAEYLKSIGCFYVQGYLYSRPVPVKEYEALAATLSKERRMISLKTVESLDNSAFWNPKSLETLIFNSFVGAACVFEYRDGKTELLRVNEKYVREIFGDRAPHTPVLNINPPDYASLSERAALFDGISSAILTGDEAQCEMRLSGLPGVPETVYLRFVMRLLARTGTRYMFYATVQNITVQRVAEEKLRMSEEQCRLALAHSGSIIFRYDIAECRVTMSPEVAAFFGTPNELENVPYSTVENHEVTSETADEYVRFYEDIKRGIPNGYATFCVSTKHGLVWYRAAYSTIFSDSGEPVYAVISFSDITRQREQEGENRALKENERVFRMVAAHSNRVIYRYDIAAGVVSVDSPTSVSPNGIAFDDDIPEGAIKRGDVMPDSVKDYREVFRKIKSGVPSGSLKLHMRASDGAPHWVDLKYSVLPDGAGQPQMAVLSFLDITADHERELAYERYRQTVLDDLKRDDVIYFDTDLTLDLVEVVGGKLPAFAFPPAGGKHDETVRSGVSILPVVYHESLWSFFSREHLITSFAEGKRYLAKDWSIELAGKMQCFRTEIQMIEDPYSGHIRAYTTLRDITDEKLDILDLQKQAETDGMTGLYNKTTAEAMVRQALRRQNGAPCVMMIADLDNLKAINDTLGHPHGDRAIRLLADALRAQFRRGDIVGRIGGDEMLVFLSDAGDKHVLTNAMNALMKRLQDIKLDENDRVRLCASIGIALGHAGLDTFEGMYTHADRALYEVKRKGKNGFAFYGSDAGTTLSSK